MNFWEGLFRWKITNDNCGSPCTHLCNCLVSGLSLNLTKSSIWSFGLLPKIFFPRNFKTIISVKLKVSKLFILYSNFQSQVFCCTWFFKKCYTSGEKWHVFRLIKNIITYKEIVLYMEIYQIDQLTQVVRQCSHTLDYCNSIDIQ